EAADDAPAALPPDARRDRHREQFDDRLSSADRPPAAVPRSDAGAPRRDAVRLEDLDYALPPELIAQEPAAERTAARLLPVPRTPRGLAHHTVAALPRLLRPGDLLVLNDARVVPARVHGRRPSGGRLELLLLGETAGGEWEALVRGAPRVGERVHVPEGSGE